jgi:hypothetical protein
MLMGRWLYFGEGIGWFFGLRQIFLGKQGGVLARMTQCKVFDPDEVVIAHIFNRVRRRCFLMGEDPVSGKNLDHRKVWIVQYIVVDTASYGAYQNFKTLPLIKRYAGCVAGKLELVDSMRSHRTPAATA